MRVEKYNGPYMVPYNEVSEVVDITRSYSSVLQLAGISNGVENGDCSLQFICVRSIYVFPENGSEPRKIIILKGQLLEYHYGRIEMRCQWFV
jgi:hypothetical protein